MEKNRIIQLLQYEHECMHRKANSLCDSNCEKCDIVQDDKELHEMYDELITFLNNTSMTKAHVISIEEVFRAPLGSVVWLEVAYEGFDRTGMEPFLVDIDNSQYPVITNSRNEYDNISKEQLKEDILDSLNKDYIGKFRFWNGKASDELKKNTPWVEGEYYYYE